MSAKRINVDREIFKQALVKAFGVHLVIGIVLFGSFNVASTHQVQEIKVTAAPVIKAKAVDSEQVKKLVDAKAERIQKQLDAQKREQRKKQQRIAEQRKREQQARDAKAQEQKRIADQKQREQQELERQKKLAEQQRIAEQQAEAKRKAEQAEAKRKAEAEAEAKRIAEAEAAKQRAAKERQVLSEMDKYTRLIKDKVSRNWIINNQSGQCILLVKITSSGFVIDVREESGNPLLCRSAKAAVYKADPLPVPSDPDVFARMRNLRLILDPDDL